MSGESIRGAAWFQPRHDGERWIDTDVHGGTYQFCCPGCGLVGDIDADQMEGVVSIDCPECDFHETFRPRVIAMPTFSEKQASRGGDQ